MRPRLRPIQGIGWSLCAVWPALLLCVAGCGSLGGNRDLQVNSLSNPPSESAFEDEQPQALKTSPVVVAASYVDDGQDEADDSTPELLPQEPGEPLKLPPKIEDDDHSDVDPDGQPNNNGDPSHTPPEEVEIDENAISTPIRLTEVAASIHGTFPLLEAAYQENRITFGKQVAALGAFDTKLKGASDNGPVGFYETYRHSAGISQALYQGGEVFGGYRIGRGEFQPWYQERETNGSGEFKAGVSIPLLRNRAIDARRAELWRSEYDRQRANPEIRTALILFVRDGSIAYWDWIAAGRNFQIAETALEFAQKRNAQIKRKVDVGETDPPVLQDNQRAIAKRQAKVLDLQRKLQQTAFKLSLFYRTSGGVPQVPTAKQLADFPDIQEPLKSAIQSDVASAIAARPELAALDALARRVEVDMAEARNDMLPAVNAQLVGSQDMGTPTSSKMDKSPFELEAGISMDFPLQQRKGRGKFIAARGKRTQIAAKREFVENKIGVEVQSARAALRAAYLRAAQAKESKRLADLMAEIERRKFELGESDLLAVVLREQQAIEAAELEVAALYEYFIAKALYDAALARDWPEP